MKSAALVALLPLLATLSTALPSPPAPRDEVTGHVRKSLSFGPKHDHARFEILEVGPVSEVGLLEHVDVNEVARRFIGEKLGGVDGFYIRDDVSINTLWSYIADLL
jgi:extracellular elastinolytic metalloproteinase